MKQNAFVLVINAFEYFGHRLRPQTVGEGVGVGVRRTSQWTPLSNHNAINSNDRHFVTDMSLDIR